MLFFLGKEEGRGKDEHGGGVGLNMQLEVEIDGNDELGGASRFGNGLLLGLSCLFRVSSVDAEYMQIASSVGEQVQEVGTLLSLRATVSNCGGGGWCVGSSGLCEEQAEATSQARLVGSMDWVVQQLQLGCSTGLTCLFVWLDQGKMRK